MSATILSDLDGLLKRHYSGDFIATQQQTDPDVLSLFSTAPEKPGGEDGAVRFGVRMQRRQNGGAQNQNEQFRANETGTRKQATIAAKINIWAIELTGFAITLSKSQVDAFVAGLEDEFEDALAMMKKDENRQIFSNGLGTLTTITTGVTASLTVVVGNVQYLFPGERIDIVTAGGVVEASNVLISSFVESTKTLTLAQTITCTTGSSVYRAGVYLNMPGDGKEMMGLRGLSDDNEDFTTFQGLSRATYSVWQGSVTDAGSVQITNDLLQRMVDKGERRSGRVIDTIISHRNQRRQYLNVVTPLKRFQDDDLDSGFKALEWNGMRWLVSHDCQRDTVYGFPRKEIQKYEAFGIKLDDTGGTTVYHIPRTDTYESYYKHYCNIGTKYPASIVRLQTLATLTD
jgi:hypothetical protein